MIKKALFCALLFSLLFSLNAKPEFWLGGSFVYEMNYLTTEEKSNYLVPYSESINMVNSGGFSVRGFFVPHSKVKAGITLGVSVLLPVGYNDSTGINSYYSRHLDGRVDLSFGIGYIQMLDSKIGLMANAGMKYSAARVAQSNEPNSRTVPDVNSFYLWSAVAELGLIWIHHNSFFMLSAETDFTLFHSDFGLKGQLSVSAGYIF